MRKRPSHEERAPSPTLEDVARAAGVSTATVSRCLNAPERVVAKTRERVLSVVQELGYAPNFGARALAARRTNTIGAIIPTMENAIFARGLQAFQEELAEHGLTLLVASSSYRPELEEQQIRTLLARGADALLLIGFERSQAVYDFLERRSVPFIIAWAHREGAGQIAIGFDNRKPMRELGDRVFGLGHRRLAIITAPRTVNDRARDRVSGILEAARTHGVQEREVRIIETEYSVENGAKAMGQLMAMTPRPTAVMCGNDVLAVGAIGMARTLGLAIPGDVSVTGFDDIELARIVMPSLTTVHVPHREMGRQAARRIAGLLAGERSRQGMELATAIVERESLGPAPE